MAKEPRLSRRERQILDILFELGEAAAEEVRRRLPEPPSSSAVRTLLSRLEAKGTIHHREAGLKYLYSPVLSRRRARRSAISRLIRVFFAGSRGSAVTAMLGGAEDLSDGELDEIAELIDQEKKQRRSR